MKFNKPKVLLTIVAAQAIVCDLATATDIVKIEDIDSSSYGNLAQKLVGIECAIKLNNAIALNPHAWYAKPKYRDSVVKQIKEAIIKKISGELDNRYKYNGNEKESIVIFPGTDIKKYTRANYNALVLYNFIDECENSNTITEEYINKCINVRVKAIKATYKDDINENTLEAAVRDVKEYLQIPGVIDILERQLSMLDDDDLKSGSQKRFNLEPRSEYAQYLMPELKLNNNITAKIKMNISNKKYPNGHIGPLKKQDNYLDVKINSTSIIDMRANMMPEEYEKIMNGLRSILSSELQIDTTAITDYINWGQHPNKEYEGKLIIINALNNIDTKYLDKPEEPLEEDEDTIIVSEEKEQYSYKDYEDTYKEYEYMKIPNDLTIKKPEMWNEIVSDEDE